MKTRKLLVITYSKVQQLTVKYTKIQITKGGITHWLVVYQTSFQLHINLNKIKYKNLKYNLILISIPSTWILYICNKNQSHVPHPFCMKSFPFAIVKKTSRFVTFHSILRKQSIFFACGRGRIFVPERVRSGPVKLRLTVFVSGTLHFDVGGFNIVYEYGNTLL